MLFRFTIEYRKKTNNNNNFNIKNRGIERERR